MGNIDDNKFNTIMDKEMDVDYEQEKEMGKDSKCTHQKQFNKQYNYNNFDQKVIVKQYQGKKSKDEADTESESEN